jgi:hypothetical protein
MIKSQHTQNRTRVESINKSMDSGNIISDKDKIRVEQTYESKDYKFTAFEDKDRFSDANIKLNRYNNEIHEKTQLNNNLQIQLNNSANNTNKFVSELNEIKLK